MKIQKSYPMKISAAGLLLFACITTLLSLTRTKPVAGNHTAAENNCSSSNTLFIHTMYTQIHQAGANLSEDLFSLAFMGFEKISAQGRLSADSLLTIIDFSKSSREKGYLFWT